MSMSISIYLPLSLYIYLYIYLYPHMIYGKNDHNQNSKTPISILVPLGSRSSKKLKRSGPK